MAQEIFNDVTVVWTPLVGEEVTLLHTNVTLDDGAGEAPTSSAGDLLHTFSDGIESLSTVVQFKGSAPGVVLGSWGGELTITGMDGGLACCGVFDKSVSGSEDGAIEGSATFLPTPAVVA